MNGPIYIQPQRPQFNHSFHLILDAISCGIWIPFHIGYWLLRRLG